MKSFLYTEPATAVQNTPSLEGGMNHLVVIITVVVLGSVLVIAVAATVFAAIFTIGNHRKVFKPKLKT